MVSHCLRRNVIRFFKIILKSTLQEGKLKVPNNFIRKYGAGLSNPVFLKPPDGTEWEVCWTKHDGEVWFEKGWKQLAKYYSLGHGHLLMFKYEGTCHFEVYIFDMSALEIDYPLHGTHDKKDKLEQIRDYSIEILDEISQKERPKSPSSSLCPYKKTRNSTSRGAERTSNLKNLHQGVQIQDSLNEGEGKKFEKSKDAELNSINQESEEDIGRSKFSTIKYPNSKAITPRKKPLTVIEKAKALQRVSTFMSKNPYFKIAMQPSYIFKRTLSVPAKFAKHYLKKKKEGDVLLQVLDGRTWCAKYSVCLGGSKQKFKISCGWNLFAKDNNLKVGDVCVFELTKSIGISFLVYIFRDSENPSCSKYQSMLTSNQKARPKTPLSYPQTHKKMRTCKHKDAERSSKLQNLHVGVKTKGVQSQRIEFQKTIKTELTFCQHKLDEDLGRSIFSKTKCLSTKRKRKMKPLTAVEKIKALKRASTFMCENPFFMVVMQPSYVNNQYRLSIPTKFAEKYLKKKHGVVQLQALDGRTWYAMYNIPKISAGWEEFVMDNNLKVGDVCAFEMIGIGLSFKVSIFKDAEDQNFSPPQGNLKLDALSQMQISMQNRDLGMASSFKSKNPYFLVYMQQSYILGKSNLHVPIKFAKTYLHIKNSTGSVKFQIQDRVWSVGYIFRRSGKQHIAEFSGGWNQFRKDNDLKVGDICVFELFQRIHVTFQVTIFRATKYPSHTKDPGKANVQSQNPILFDLQNENFKPFS